MNIADYYTSRSYNSSNPFQGYYKRVLCVCSAGLLRSPTTAIVLSQKPFNFNTRAVGIEESFALILVDQVLLEWADEIVCMTQGQKERLSKLTNRPIHCLEIEDSFAYRDKKLMRLIKKNYKKVSGWTK